MANQLGAGTSGGSGSGGSGSGSAEVILAGVREARKALFVMVGFIVVIWALQIANWAGHYGLDTSYGIIPRNVLRLPDIFIAPFLHFSWSHIEANSGPLFVFGFLAAYRGVWRFVSVTVLIAITSGMAIWFFASTNTLTVGASGLIFGYFGYVVARGLIDRNLIDALVGAVMALSFAYLVTVAVPGTPGVSWIGHLGGLVGGVAAGWLFRSRRGKVPAKPEKKPDGGAGGSTRPLPVSADNPRADLHAELRKLGL
ncbi:MAG: rhomboid family intramembrane serine protease [Micromonosporaceae bacterium]